MSCQRCRRTLSDRACPSCRNRDNLERSHEIGRRAPASDCDTGGMKPETMQQDELRRAFVAGFTIEDVETIDLDVPEQHVSTLRCLGFPIAHYRRLARHITFIRGLQFR